MKIIIESQLYTTRDKIKSILTIVRAILCSFVRVMT